MNPDVDAEFTVVITHNSHEAPLAVRASFSKRSIHAVGLLRFCGSLGCFRDVLAAAAAADHY